MAMVYVLDEHGQPQPAAFDDPRHLALWAYCGDPERDPRRVALSQVGEWRISTVFLAINHAWGDGPPVLWETMIFGPEPWCEWQDRYTSRADAEAGHARIVQALIDGKTPEDMD